MTLAQELENLEQMQQREKPYLLALYQANLGELEYKLLTMQVECRALQQRIQLAMVYLNRGECLTEQKLQAIDQQVKQDLLTWHTQLNEQAQMLSAGFAYLQDLTVVDTNIVQRVKQAYRRLSRLLHLVSFVGALVAAVTFRHVACVIVALCGAIATL